MSHGNNGAAAGIPFAGYSRDTDMEAFDLLDPRIRAALNDSLIKWSPADVLMGMGARFMSVEQVVALIRRKDAAYAARVAAERGIG